MLYYSQLPLNLYPSVGATFYGLLGRQVLVNLKFGSGYGYGTRVIGDWYGL
jgi:hypothetical protein